jgi:hypothetical protein
MKPTALYATQNIIHIRYQCPHRQAVVSYFTEEVLVLACPWQACVMTLLDMGTRVA